ncbi:hypothetical protein H9L10_00075 [Phycicoccus endophyticus]|uniref:Uncharacterized protein n=1 Tax=Phycicoccus endophyticus TaxID=1690220 RepID=A0A7G9R1V4_9MICO|nr:hypothetical protein [Phycicoccus endophyticus]NHI18623.1 hypothetical protein [Phycicoccus endophyticus]QNN49579.1 hypothetical protein H9L10_00075 [Phycicoccus endophyticus]GGL37752.1 hypothetical protein GCM10012283_20460 [Phycicoccus endophyticus]
MDQEAAPSTGGPVEPETRAARRARVEAIRRHPVLPEMALVPRPLVVVATVVLVGLLVPLLRTDPVLLAGGLAWTGVVLAWGWPRLLGSSSRFGSSLAVGVAAVAAPVLGVVPGEEPYLRLVPVGLAVGLGVMFVHQIARRDGRPRLTESIGVTSFGLGLVTVGTTWLPLAYSGRATDLASAAFVAVAVGSLADLAAGVRLLRAWLLPVAMVLGAAGAIVAASILGFPQASSAALVGLLAAAVAHALRRALVVLPPVTARRSQLAVAAAGVLVPGVVVYGAALVLIG